MLLDCELVTGPAASADEDADDGAGLCAEGSKNRAPSGARDLLVIIDSENICDFFERAWRYGDVRRLRGETYGLRMEEALLLRRWLQMLDAEVHTLRLSSHCGFIPNVWADAVANAARLLALDGEPPLVVRRTLAFLCKVGGAGMTWGPSSTCSDQAEGARSAAELDSRLSKKVRALADTCAVQLLIREGVKVWQIFRRGRDARTEIEELVFLVKEGPVSDDEMTGEGRAGRDARAMFEQAQRDLLCAVDGTASPELLEGRLFATPFFDFEGEGLDVTKGQQLFDRRIQGALSIQRGGGYGSQVELTRVGMRHILRNFAQSVLPELGEGVASSTPTEGETLPLCICPACHVECRCDFFHFFECASGISEAARSACCRALEQHATMLDVPSAEDGEGEGDLHLELAWARVALLAKRQPGELGRYRRYLAAKALCGAFAMPSAASVRAAAMADCWQCESSRQESTAEAAANDDDDELDELECEEARPRSEFDYMRLAEARRKFNKWYVARAIALNTVVIDHLRAEFGDWLGRMKRGHAGLRGAYGGDYQRHYTGGRGRVLDEQLCGMFYPANGSAGVPMSEADFDKGIAAELQPGRFVRVVGGETLVRTHGTADARREELRKKRDEGKERERLRAEEGRFKYARLEQERELGELLERRIERGFEGLSEPDEEESALLADGGRERALRLMREASAVGARAWLMPDGGEAMRAARAIGGADERADEGGVGVAPAHMDGDFDEMIVDDVAAPLLQATQLYGTVNEDIEEESEVDEAVRRAPFCQATQQHGVSLAGEDAVDDDDEAVQRCGWFDARLAESTKGLAARWAACGLEMNDELTGELSAAREVAECMSEMASDDVHDELMCSMDVVAEVHAQDAEREQQSEGVSVGCVRHDGDGVSGGNSADGRGLEGEDGGDMGCESADGVEQGASMAACEAEDSDEDEAMVGKENASMQRAEYGGGAAGDIKKRKHKRCMRKGKGHRKRLAMARANDLRLAADEASVS